MKKQSSTNVCGGLQLIGFWVAGFTDAEGCWSIYMTENKLTGYIQVSFAFYLSQVDLESLKKIQKLLSLYALEKDPTVKHCFHLTQGHNVTEMVVHNHRTLTHVIQPFFETYKLQSSKVFDQILFYASLNTYLDLNLSPHERRLRVSHYVFYEHTRPTT